jgi:drug/metabolite transporter (DMT)-like permease
MTIDALARKATAAPAGTGEERRIGLALACITAVVSGVAVFVNGYGVRRFDDATTYTTAKNLVAGIALAALALLARDRDHPGARVPRRAAVVAVIGGSVPFVLFFEGLQRVGSTDAAFIQKTLVVWVAILAVALLKERLGLPHLVAIAAILVGQAEMAGGVGWPVVGTGELMILVATWCWAGEFVISRVLLRSIAPVQLGVVRMLGGAAVLLAWAVLRGAADDLVRLSPGQWGWAALTGGMLTVYVASWLHALARCPAVDVSAVLVLGAVVTAVLDGAVNGTDLRPLGAGMLLVAAGVGVVVAVGARSTVAVTEVTA